MIGTQQADPPVTKYHQNTDAFYKENLSNPAG